MARYGNSRHDNALAGLVLAGLGLVGYGLYQGALWIIEFMHLQIFNLKR